MRTYSIFPALLLGFVFISHAVYSQTSRPEITSEDLQAHISFLASDELQGRYPGTPGSRAAAEYIREQFSEAGLKLLGSDGFQEFDVVTRTWIGENNTLRIREFNAVPGTDFTPFPFSKNATLTAEVVFAGYGFDIEQDSLSWQDYDQIEAAGKWVMVLRGDPEMDKDNSRFAPFGDDRDKVLTARDKGAAGVLFVSGKRFDAADDLIQVYFDKTQSNAGIPVIHIKRSVADKILEGKETTVEALEEKLGSEQKPRSFALPISVSATTEVLHDQVQARNVVGLLEGSDPVLKETFVVIGAHYDHLGLGGTGSGSRFMDSLAVHNGADDNASGTAGVLELAARLASERASLKRSVLFIAFDAEELGLLGSKYFVEHPLIDLNKVMAMINFDMIGRMKTENPGIMIGGTGTSLESEQILLDLETGGVQLNFSPEGFGPSDHAAFYGEDITVFFISSGAHEDYHTPDDDWQQINYPGAKSVLDIAEQLIFALSNRDAYLSFREAGPKQQTGRGGYRFKVTLGIMPDFAGQTQGGLGVGGVKKDGPAYKGGILKGDVITAMDGRPVNDIYDYMNRLKKLQPGQVISVDVKRGEENLVLIVQL